MDLEIFIEDRGIKVDENMIITSPRVGVDYAGEWAKKPLRFHLDERLKFIEPAIRAQ